MNVLLHPASCIKTKTNISTISTNIDTECLATPRVLHKNEHSIYMSTISNHISTIKANLYVG